jgi:hypothetical protein
MVTFKNLKAHFMIEFNTSEQIKAHKMTASIITTLESNSRALKYECVELWLFVETGELILSD